MVWLYATWKTQRDPDGVAPADERHCVQPLQLMSCTLEQRSDMNIEWLSELNYRF
jgi:hypothetical protein